MKIERIFFIILFILFLSSCQESPVEPENQFVQIYLKYSFNNELNTFENTLQKDLILDGVKKVKFWLSTEEQNSILAKANSINYFLTPDTFKFKPEDSNLVSIDPDPGEQILRIKYQNKDKTTFWTYPLDEENIQSKNLLELQQFIIEIIESKPEYKKLPAPRGGYL